MSDLAVVEFHQLPLPQCKHIELLDQPLDPTHCHPRDFFFFFVEIAILELGSAE